MTLEPPSSLPAPPVAPSPSAPKRRGRPAFGLVVGGLIGLRLVRQVVEWIAVSTWGVLGAVLATAAAVGFVLAWRYHQRHKVRARGGLEHTPEEIAEQLQDSGLLPPAFGEDGTILGASVLVLNQRPKVLEVETQYELFGSGAQPLGTVRQIAQSRGKRIARVLTFLDQYFTHHFEVEDAAGGVVLRLTRPRKIFRSRLRVFDAADEYLGAIQQENVFWKIRFHLVDPHGRVLARLNAANVRAWDFHIEADGREIATIVKSWEGWGRTAWTRADRYVLKVHQPLPDHLAPLVASAPLMVDLALKQDVRGFG